MSILKSYLEGMSEMREAMPTPKGWKHGCIESAVLQWGKPFDQSPLNQWPCTGFPKHCFNNSIEYMLDNDPEGQRLHYCEGFALADIGIPIHHGWVWDAMDRAVIDPTWRMGNDYYGIVFQRDFAVRKVIEGETSCLDDWVPDEQGRRWEVLIHGADMFSNMEVAR